MSDDTVLARLLKRSIDAVTAADKDRRRLFETIRNIVLHPPDPPAAAAAAA